MRVASMLLASLASVAALGAALAVGASGCLRSTSFACDTDTQCGAGGTCQGVGFCSFADATCGSGQRFGASAGTYADQCVEGGTPTDGGIDGNPLTDAPLTDAAMVDAPVQAGCPAGYDAITGGEGTHKYKVLTTTGNWGAQRDACAATSASAYLAIPGDATELAALLTATAATRQWIGVTDSATEGTYLDVKGGVPAFLPWGAAEPDDPNPGEDCVSADDTAFQTDKCALQFRAVCECEP